MSHHATAFQPLERFTREQRARVGYVLTDIDDTLTTDGLLVAEAYSAMAALDAAGIRVIPITGRPAGWCDHIARMWPVAGLVGENGAFYFCYDRIGRRMIRRYWKDEPERAADRVKLDRVRDRILAQVPGCAVASDQAYREADLAIDFCEDVPALPRSEVQRIQQLFEAEGAHAKISSIHVNGWFGEYDKLVMSRLLFQEVFGERLDDMRDTVVFSGDSPNDSPMFGYFPHSVGVANVLEFADLLDAPPTYVTPSVGGQGFAELAEALLSARG